MNYSFKTICLSSLSKIFPDEELLELPFTKATALRNEVFSFQVAYYSDNLMKGIQVKVNTNGLPDVSLRSVGLVPSELPCYGDYDDYILRSKPGLYPDPLYPINENDGITAFPYQWRSLWITVKISDAVKASNYPIEIKFYSDKEELLSEEVFNLEVISAPLPKQKFIHTEWFYTDCLATWYGVETFSEKYWELIDNYLQNAVSHGINMILTPVFTPPLETEVGHERPTMQLVEVNKHEQKYTFDFQKLDRWVELCLKRGIEYFEISHLFTQWGALHAPKIVATENGQSKTIFGWDTEALGQDYQNFLSQFLPELISYFEIKQLKGKIFFHISDEPWSDQLNHYQKISKLVSSFIKDYPVIDALSDFEFYKSGSVTKPIPSIEWLDPFIENNVENLWTYYCCGDYKKGASNRFFSMPSVRNRIIGVQFYKYNFEGFLHWGYNHWYSCRSIKPINPFMNTDANYGFPSGDAFLVYPGENGPIDSLRHEVFHDALQDLRALRLLESLVGREAALELLEKDLTIPLTFTEYPKALSWILSMRETINKAIKLEWDKRSNIC